MILHRIEPAQGAPAQGASREPPAGGSATETMQAQIGLQLKAVYETMIAQPIPDRFVELLERLERERAAGKGATASKPAEGTTPSEDDIS